MIFGVRNGLCFSFIILLAFSQLCYATARKTLFFSNDDEASSSIIVRRSLMINLEDYGEPTANRGHDPSWNKASGASHEAGRKRKG